MIQDPKDPLAIKFGPTQVVDPLASKFGAAEQTASLGTTAVGRQQMTRQNIDENISRLESIAARSSDEKQKQRIAKIIASMKSGYSRGIAPDAIAGIAEGAASAIPEVTDLAFALPSKLPIVGAGFRDIRDRLHETKALLHENAGTPETTAGTVGQIAGSMIPDLAGGVVSNAAKLGTHLGVFGPLAEVAGAPLAKAASRMAPDAAAKIAALSRSSSMATRVATGAGKTVGKGLSFGVLSALGMDDADSHDMLKTILIQAGADAIFGGLGGVRVPKQSNQSASKTSKLIDQATTQAEEVGKTSATNHSAETEASRTALEETKRKALAQKEAAKQLERLARAAYEQENPTLKWSDLKSSGRKAYRDKFINETAAQVKANEAAKAGSAGNEGTAPGGGAAGVGAGQGVDALGNPTGQTPASKILQAGGSIGDALDPSTNGPQSIQAQIAALKLENAKLKGEPSPLADASANTNLYKPPVEAPPPAPVVDPIEAKLAQLKQKMAEDPNFGRPLPEEPKEKKQYSWKEYQDAQELGIDGVTPTNLVINKEDLEGLAHGKAQWVTDKDKLEQIVRKLGRTLDLVKEGGHVDELTPEQTKALALKALVDAKVRGERLGVNKQQVDTLLKEHPLTDEAIADKQATDKSNEATKSRLFYEMFHALRGNRRVNSEFHTELAQLAEKTGITPEALEAEIKARVYKEVETRLAYNKENINEHSRVTWPNLYKGYVEEVPKLERILAERDGKIAPDAVVPNEQPVAATYADSPPVTNEPDGVEAKQAVLRADATPEPAAGATAPPAQAISPPPAVEPTVPTPQPIPATEGKVAGFLKSVSTGKKLEDMDLAAVDKAKDKVFDKLDENPENQEAIDDLELLAQRTKELHGSGEQLSDEVALEDTHVPEPDDVADPLAKLGAARGQYVDPSNSIVEARVVPKKEPIVIDEETKKFKGLATKSLRKATDEDLKFMMDHIDSQLQELPKFNETRTTLEKIMDKVVNEQAARSAPTNSGPIIAQSPPGVGGFLAGFVGGYVTTDDDSQKVTNGLMWGAIGALGATAISKIGKGSKPLFRPEGNNVMMDAWEKSAKAKVVNISDKVEFKPGLLAQMRTAYQNTIHGTLGLEDYVDAIGARGLAAAKNPAKLGAMVGEWVSRAEQWITSVPATLDDGPDGKILRYRTDIKSLKDIHDMVDGDTDKLARVMVAYSSEELRYRKRVPYDEVTAQMVLSNADEKYHQAAREIRKYHGALVDEMVKAGVVSEAGREVMMQEAWYTPLWRIIETGKPVDLNTSQVIGSSNPVKARKNGSEMRVQNPWESTIQMTANVMRSVEMNNIKQAMIDAMEVNPKAAKGWIERIGNKEVKSSQAVLDRVNALKSEIPNLTTADALSLTSAAMDNRLPAVSNVMTAYRDGVLRSYKVNDAIAMSMRGLMPSKELYGLGKLLGAGVHLERLGIVSTPWFIFKRSFVDTWLTTMNSQYGFRPGIDSFIGWWHIMQNSPQFKEMRAVGGGNSTLMSGRFGDLEAAVKQMDNPRGFAGVNHAMKTMNFVQAWKEIGLPVLEACRMGEYLRARGHSTSVIDPLLEKMGMKLPSTDPITASLAAKEAIGNFGMKGASPLMQALNRGTLFLNPTLQALDHGVYRMGMHPFRTPEEGRMQAAATFMTKAFVTMTLPSIYFYMHNFGDEEINDLRKSEGGSRYWYFRSPINSGVHQANEIIRIPKPELAGHLFGTTAEHALDIMHKQDPEGFQRMFRDAVGDLAPNVIPQMMGIFVGLGANHDVGSGSQVVSKSVEGLMPDMQANPSTPSSIRYIGKYTGKIAEQLPMDGALGAMRRAMTPAGMEYLVGQLAGTVGLEGVRVVGQAMDYVQKGMVPAKNEYVVIGQFFQNQQSMSVASVQDFYNKAEKVDEIAKSMTKLSQNNPELALNFMQRHMEELQLVPVITKSRELMGQYSKALDDIRQLPADMLSDPDRQEMIRFYRSKIIEQARMSNEILKSLKE